ncbi:MAG: hypothetical protein AB7S26_35535 [Sandaracinaceae bacterium]
MHSSRLTRCLAFAAALSACSMTTSDDDAGPAMRTDAGSFDAGAPSDAGPGGEAMDAGERTGPCGTPLGVACSDRVACPMGWVCGGTASNGVCVPEGRDLCDNIAADCPSGFPSCVLFAGGTSGQGVCLITAERDCLCAPGASDAFECAMP